MFSNLKCAVREFLGIPQMQSRLAEAIEGCRRVICWQQENSPVLATVTILCDTPSDDGGGKTRTTFGGEVFLRPGQKHTLSIPYSQCLVANCTYFVSGHPNIVLTDFRVGHDSKFASDCGVKYGQCSFAIEVGQLIQVRLEYRLEGQSL